MGLRHIEKKVGCVKWSIIKNVEWIAYVNMHNYVFIKDVLYAASTVVFICKNTI